MKRALVAALFFATPVVAQQQAKPDWAAFDTFVAQAAKDWRVPALAIAVVKDDSVVFMKGYGVLESGKPTRADEHTRFAIGSTTKAMTSAGLAMLVDEGKLHWDDKVTRFIPELQLADPWATREMTIRDLLTHRTGLPGTDLFWASNWKFSPAEIIRRLRYIQPTASFRSEWQYQNVMYALGGTIIERASGMRWEDFMRARVFKPLGMNETEALVSSIVGKPNVAVPHALIGDSVRVVPVRSTDLVAPAGSVWSSVSDMSKWMRFVLDSGRVGSTRLIKAETFREIVAPQIQAPMEEYPALQLAKPDFFSYGFGWFIQDYRGQHVWMHTGSINGLCALIGLMPNEKLGVYVLENLDHAEIRHGLMYSVFDLYNGGRGRDWSADLKPLFERRPAQAGNAATQRTTSPPSLPLERYAGTYVDSAYGEIRVTFENGALQAALVTDPPTALQPLNMEAFRAQPAEAGRNPATLVFQPDGAGGVVSVRVSGITFTKVRR
ncbi:MAG TPA: serine hydrolase [Gemmatimonadaceae bacterium]|jgi:CubicO group peptidase (beta-lactamase class C family)|nr:serine hydrolase [Gemmatimonadaceae bacterium]